MKLIGNLKKSVEKTETKEEARALIEDAGMKLSDEELDQVVGGVDTLIVTKQMTGWKRGLQVGQTVPGQNPEDLQNQLQGLRSSITTY